MANSAQPGTPPESCPVQANVALRRSAPFVTPQGSTVWHRRFAPTFTMRDDRFDAQSTKVVWRNSIAIVAAIH